MPVFHLQPRDAVTSDPSWESSSLKEGCWIDAGNEDDARRQVASATFSRCTVKQAEDEVRSPWTQPRLTKCKADTSATSVPFGQVLSETGKIIDIAPRISPLSP
jgi:hypothetical protein